jgi:hypothetical protein
MGTDTVDDSRLIVEGIVAGGEVCFLAESQVRAGDAWTLERQWGPTPWRRARMPSARDALDELRLQVSTWLDEREA